MLLGKNYKIEADNLNVILSEKHLITGKGRGRPTNKPIGSEYWEPIAYFFTVKAALDYFVRQEIRNTEIVDIKTVVAKIEELHELIKSLDENHLQNIVGKVEVG